MFKDFSEFNSKASLLFKDEVFNLVATAFSSFKALLQQLRSEAYDYTTWYNKVMRDKYEDGTPVDVTDLPYLSVPRSQLAIMRARIMRVRELVQYAANAITNTALGWKVDASQLIHSAVDTISGSIHLTATTQQPLLNAIKRIKYCIGDLFVTFDDGDQTVQVNGVSLSLSPLVRGTIHLVKYSSGDNARAGVGSFRSGSTIRSVAGEMIRSIAKAPLIVARSSADLAAGSLAPIGLLIANRAFFSKRLIIWAESGAQLDTVVAANKMTIHEAVIKAALVDAADVKSTIASSLYGYLSEDYVEAMSFNAPGVPILAQSIFMGGAGDFTYNVNGTEQVSTAFNYILIVSNLDASASQDIDAYGSYSDVVEATTQTAISDMFLTEQEWDGLLSSLSEA